MLLVDAISETSPTMVGCSFLDFVFLSDNYPGESSTSTLTLFTLCREMYESTDLKLRELDCHVLG